MMVGHQCEILAKYQVVWSLLNVNVWATSNSMIENIQNVAKKINNFSVMKMKA